MISAFMDQHDQWLIECQKLGFEPSPRRYSQGTVTSEDAAAQIGCDVAQIAKSIVFEGQSCAIVVIASGANKVDRKKKLRAILGYKPKVATPEYVLRETGFAPGGVPPFGHKRRPEILMDRDLFGFEVVWGAAGSSETVFPIPPDLLASISSASIADVRL